MINISGLTKAFVLKALYDGSKFQGFGFLQAKDSPLTLEEATILCERHKDSRGYIYFDYLYGKVMKVEISTNELDPFLYDRDNGEGAAERAILKAIERSHE